MSDGWLAALLGPAGPATVGLDTQGRAVFWSAAAQSLFGWSEHEVIGRVPPFVPVALRSEWQLQVERDLEASDVPQPSEAQRLTHAGQMIWVVRSARAVRDTKTRTIGLLETCIDVTTLKHGDEEGRALVQVRERELIAMDLHDGLIQSLYAVVLNLAAQEQALTSADSEAQAALKAARVEVERSIEETRSYLFNLRARQLSPRTLASGFRLLADALRLNGGIDVQLRVDPEAEALLHSEARGHVLFLVREAVSNVLRHANASLVRIEISRASDNVLLGVIDNGRGFEPAARTSARQYGLHNMAERARLVGGRLEVKSRPGNGTTVRLALPVGV